MKIWLHFIAVNFFHLPNIKTTMKYTLKTLYAALGMFLLHAVTFAQAEYVPTKENLENRKTFQDNKFGLFIHWGVYSTLADGEWVMRHRDIPVSQYEKLPPYFNPIGFDAEAWVLMAKNAGMKYITFTSRHHDGFAMFDSKVSDYNVAQKTPYKKDIVAELSKACKKYGMQLFLYYSHLDWHHNDYFPRSNTSINKGGQDWSGRPPSGNWSNYLKYMNGQLAELLTNYGTIGGIWFDGWWDNKEADWKLKEQYELIHKLQPGCLIGNNHHQSPKLGEDFQMFEKDLPGHNTTGFAESDVTFGSLPIEMCETMNNSWGYNLKDRKFKSSKFIVQLLVKNAGYNSNLLLNVGPQPDGRIMPENIDTLKKVGSWLAQYGTSIYGTRGGIFPIQQWGVIVKKEQTHYIHVLEMPTAGKLFIPGWPGKPKRVTPFIGNKKIPFKVMPEGLLLDLAGLNFDGIDLVLTVQ